MTIISIGDAPSYTIPLDSLDLTYLSKYVSTPRAEKMPLWTRKRLDGESEYCQVEIVTRGNNNEDCYSEAPDTYQCHICNLNMPINCYQKHNNSNQHETFKKINQILLERVYKKAIVISMNTDDDIGNDSYYCEPCSKIIEIQDKYYHEATENHAKSVKDSFIINEFYKLLNENINNDDIYNKRKDASSSNESDDDLNSDLAPVHGHSIIGTVNESPKVEENAELLEEESDPFNLDKNYYIYYRSMETSRNSANDDDLSDQNSIFEIVNPSPKVEENEELSEEASDALNQNNNCDIHDKSMESSSSVDSDYDLSDLDSVLAPLPGHSIIETVHKTPNLEKNEELLEEERSSNQSDDDISDQNSTLALVSEHSVIEAVIPSPKVEENEDLLEKESDTLNRNNNFSIYEKSIETSSNINSEDDLSDQNSILAPVHGHRIIEIVNPTPKVEENEELLEKERDPLNPNNSYGINEKSMEPNSSINSEDDLSDQNSILAPVAGDSIIDTVNLSPIGEKNEELSQEESGPLNPNNNDDVHDESSEASNSNESDDDLSDQEGILAPVPGHSIIETVNQSPIVEETEELLEEEDDPLPNNNDDIHDNTMEASCSNESDDDPNSTIAPVHGHSFIETVNQSPKVEEKQSFKEYLMEMKKKYYLKVPPFVVYGEFIMIEAPNGDKVKVSREHFHGYRVVLDKMYCQSCNMWISEDTREHDVTEQHVRNIFKPINEKFGRRVAKIWSHCVPCNELVLADSDLHVHKNEHKDIIDNTLDKPTPKPVKIRCEDCSIYVNAHNFSFHINSGKHKRTLELMEQNSIQDIGNNEIFCKMCSLTLPKYVFQYHIDSELHSRRKTNDSTVLENVMGIDPNPGTSGTFNTNRNLYKNATDHRDVKNETFHEMTEFVDEDKTRVRCKICYVDFPFTENKIIAHMKGVRHIAIIRILGHYSKTRMEGFDKQKFEKYQIERYHPLLFHANKLKCQICDVNLYIQENSILSHIKGKKHAFAMNYSSFWFGQN